MIGMGFKYGVKINDINTQGGNIGKFFFDSFKVAAVVIVIKDFSSLIGLPDRNIPRVFVHYSVGGDIFYITLAFAKTVGEYLVHYTALNPLGRFIIPVIHGQLPFLALGRNSAAAAGVQKYIALSEWGFIGKVIEIQSCFKFEIYVPPFFAVPVHTAPIHIAVLCVLPVLMYNKGDIAAGK